MILFKYLPDSPNIFCRGYDGKSVKTVYDGRRRGGNESSYYQERPVFSLREYAGKKRIWFIENFLWIFFVISGMIQFAAK